uniref:Uncharacterized protein n=1 Tax=Salmo trutta TaxID=8032 RepID=A0A674AV73_SALTR
DMRWSQSPHGRPPHLQCVGLASAVAGEIREKGPAHVQSCRRQPKPPPVCLRPADGHHPDKPPHTAPCETMDERPRDEPHSELPIVARGGRWSDCSPSRSLSPAPLRNPARLTQPDEPILIPEAVCLGDLLRVRPGVRFTPSPPDFQGPGIAHQTMPKLQHFPGLGPLSRGGHIPGHPAHHKEKRTLPGAPASFSRIGRITALDASRRPSPPVRGHSESSLRSVGHMTKELLKCESLKY